jgi:hypothetical protein
MKEGGPIPTAREEVNLEMWLALDRPEKPADPFHMRRADVPDRSPSAKALQT